MVCSRVRVAEAPNGYEGFVPRTLIDDRYELRGPVGSGGMADVFVAHDEVLDRDVALKLLKDHYAENEEFVERFKREARNAASLSHPNIVSIFDRGESGDGTYYIAMEYLPGGTLKDRILKRGALPPQMAAEVALQIAEALQAAHKRGIIHRDVKPRNILVAESGDVKERAHELKKNPGGVGAVLPPLTPPGGGATPAALAAPAVPTLPTAAPG